MMKVIKVLRFTKDYLQWVSLVVITGLMQVNSLSSIPEEPPPEGLEVFTWLVLAAVVVNSFTIGVLLISAKKLIHKKLGGWDYDQQTYSEGPEHGPSPAGRVLPEEPSG